MNKQAFTAGYLDKRAANEQPTGVKNLVQALKGGKKPGTLSYRDFAESPYGYGSPEAFKKQLQIVRENLNKFNKLSKLVGKDIPQPYQLIPSRFSDARINREVPINTMSKKQAEKLIGNSLFGSGAESARGKALKKRLMQIPMYSKNPEVFKSFLKNKNLFTANRVATKGYQEKSPKRFNKQRQVYYRPDLTKPSNMPWIGHELFHSTLPPQYSATKDEYKANASGFKRWLVRNKKVDPDIFKTTFMGEEEGNDLNDFYSHKKKEQWWKHFREKIKPLWNEYLKLHKQGKLDKQDIHPMILDKALKDKSFREDLFKNIFELLPLVAANTKSNKGLT